MSDPYKRDENGWFIKGTKGGPGHPYRANQALFRKKFIEAATPEAIDRIIAKLFEMGWNGDLEAIKEILRRGMGTYEATDLAFKIEDMEAMLLSAFMKAKASDDKPA